MSVIYYLVSLIWMEVVFHLSIYGKIEGMIIYPILFSVPIALFLVVVSSRFSYKINGILSKLMMFIVTLFFSAQIVYHEVFDTFLMMKSITEGAGQAADFGGTIGDAISANGLSLFLIWIPFFVNIVLLFFDKKHEKCRFNQWSIKTVGVFLGIVLLAFLGSRLTLSFYGYGSYSPYEIYYSHGMTDQSMNKLGVITTVYREVEYNLEEKLNITPRYNKKIVGKGLPTDLDTVRYSIIDDDGKNDEPNVLDIDFAKISDKEKNETVLDMNQYFSSVTPTMKNEYTGMFKDYNLIFITAESFSKYAIDETLTQTLYQLSQEGFQFNNFYNPTWYLSTIDGEYVNLLGQIPVDGDWSFQHASQNWTPFAIGNQLNELGYHSYAYHDHDAHYYDRTVLHPTLGYNFKAVGSGLTMKSKWPESDLELAEISYEEYMNKEPFNAYYITMSGHLPYNYDFNSMAVKNREAVANLDCSTEVAAYKAANIELDKAVAYLIAQAKEKGVLDQTLFVIVPDHYPYGLKDGLFNELAGKNVEDDKFELYRSTMIIWSPSMKESIPVDKYCSSMDILPTVSNLLGIEYDSRLLAGRDAMSECEPLIMLKDRSFITDKIKYDAITNEITYITDEKVDDTYVSSKITEVNNRFKYSGDILNTDYFNIVLPEQ